MSKAIMSCTNCYNIPNMYVQGRMCKTNIFSSTAFRGFGAPQAMLISETWIDHVSSYLQTDPVTVRRPQSAIIVGNISMLILLCDNIRPRVTYRVHYLIHNLLLKIDQMEPDL